MIYVDYFLSYCKNILAFMMQIKHMSMEYGIYKIWALCIIFNQKILPRYGNRKKTLEFQYYHEQLPFQKIFLIFFSDFQ